MKNKDNILDAVKDSIRIDKIMKKENLFNRIGEKKDTEMNKENDKEMDNEKNEIKGKFLVTIGKKTGSFFTYLFSDLKL